MRIIDTHLHLVYLDRLDYPWLDDVPALKRDFTLETYRAEAESLGIEAMLHMEVDVAEDRMEDETDFVTGLGDGVVGAIAACRPESEEFPVYLERAAANPKVRGFRRILHTQPDDLGRLPLFAENIARLAAVERTFDLCLLPRQLPIGAALADSCPDVQFVLDHCGVPDIKGRGLIAWRDHLREIARRPNVACKVSGIVAYADPDWTVEDLRPYVDHVIDCFGWNRLVWGSDWPVCTQTANLTRWVEATHSLIEGASEDERARLLHRNAERIYRLS